MNQPETNRPAKKRGKFPWIIHLALVFFIFAFTFAPLAPAVLAKWVGNANGCKVEMDSSHPCVIGGKDYGHVFHEMAGLAWFAVFTFLAGAFAFGGWLIVLLLHFLVWRKGHL